MNVGLNAGGDFSRAELVKVAHVLAQDCPEVALPDARRGGLAGVDPGTHVDESQDDHGDGNVDEVEYVLVHLVEQVAARSRRLGGRGLGVHGEGIGEGAEDDGHQGLEGPGADGSDDTDEVHHKLNLGRKPEQLEEGNGRVVQDLTARGTSGKRESGQPCGYLSGRSASIDIADSHLFHHDAPLLCGQVAQPLSLSAPSPTWTPPALAYDGPPPPSPAAPPFSPGPSAFASREWVFV